MEEARTTVGDEGVVVDDIVRRRRRRRLLLLLRLLDATQGATVEQSSAAMRSLKLVRSAWSPPSQALCARSAAQRLCRGTERWAERLGAAMRWPDGTWRGGNVTGGQVASKHRGQQRGDGRWARIRKADGN